MNTLVKTTLVSALALCGFASLATARITGSGKITMDKRAVSKFHKVVLEGTGQLNIAQGAEEGLTIEGDDNVVPLIESKVGADGTLRIGFNTKEEIRPSKAVVYKLTVTKLDHIVLAGSGDIHAGALSADHFDVEMTGSGDVILDKLDTPGALKLAMPGSGDARISGHAASQTVTLDGSGDYDAPDLQTGTTTVSIAGSGDVDVWAKDKLDVKIAGSGSVTYHGSPTVTKSIAGSGTVHEAKK